MPNQNKNQNTNSNSVNSNVQGDLFTAKLMRGTPISEEIFDAQTNNNAPIPQPKHSHLLRNILYGATAAVIFLLAFATFWFYRVAHPTSKTAADYGTTSADIAALTSNKTATANGFVIINGNADVNGSVTANNFSGNGADLSNVNATRLNSQPGSFYQNADNIDSGTLNDARLSGNVVLLGSSPNFTNLLVTGTTTLQGAATLQDTLAVTGAVSFASSLNISGSQTVSGNSSVGGDLTVTGTTNINGLNYAWPGTQASGVLSNDGSGNLAWQPVGACASCLTNGGNSFGSSVSVGTNDANSLYLRTNGVDQVTLNTSGNLGIGVSPGYKLDVNGDVNVSAGNAFRIGGTAICTSGGCAASAGSTDYVQNSASLQTGVNFNFEIASINSVGGIIRAKAGQIADLQQWQNSGGVAIAYVDANGDFSANSALKINGTTVCTASGCTAAGGSGSYIQNGTVLQTTANFNIQSANAASVGGIIKGAVGQTANLQEWQDSSGNILASIGASGALSLGRASGATGSAVLYNSSGAGSITLTAANPVASTYTITFPAETGTVCTTAASGACTSAGGFVQLQASTPGTQQTGNSNISGVAIAGTAVSVGSNAASAGAIRLANTANIAWRNAANSADLTLGLDSSNSIATTTPIFFNYGSGSTNALIQAYGGAGQHRTLIAYNSAQETASFYANTSEMIRMSNAGVMIGGGGSGYVFSGNSNALRVNGPTTADSNADALFSTSLTTKKGLVIQGLASQTANLQEWQNSAGTVLSSIDASGNLNFGSSPATAGVIRLSNNTGIVARNAANSANITGLYFDTSNRVLLGDTGFNTLLRGLGVAVNDNSPTFGTVEKLRVTAPTTVDNSANVMIGTTATTSKGLVIQGVASQTASLQEWQNSAGTILAKMTNQGWLAFDTQGITTKTADGHLYIGDSSRAGATGGTNWYYGSGYYTNAAHEFLGGSATNMVSVVRITSSQAGKPALIIKGASSQSANLQEWQNSAGTVLGSISAAGVATFTYPTATNGADALVVQSTVSAPAYGTAEMRFRNYYGTGQLYLNSSIGNGGNIISNGPLTIQAANNSSGIRLATDVTVTNGAEIHLGSTNGTKQHTANSVTIASFDSTFNPTSGTGIMHYLDVVPTINQTGGANGITRGIYINPTLTAAADWRSLEIANNSGKAIYQTGTSATNLLAGVTTFSTLGSADTSTYLCRNSSNQLATCSGTATGTAFVQGGNSFGATGVLGTNDANNLQIKTNNTVRATFDQANALYLGPGTSSSTAINTYLRAPDSSALGIQGSNLNLNGGAGYGTGTGSAGGLVYVQAGNAAGSGANAGGAIQLTAGNATGAGTGGGIYLQAGTTSTGTAGLVSINAGNSTGVNATAGNVSINGGSGDNGGTVAITSGQGNNGNGGNLVLASGAGYNGASGNIYLRPQFGDSAGNVYINDNTFGATYLGNSTNGAGGCVVYYTNGLSCPGSGGVAAASERFGAFATAAGNSSLAVGYSASAGFTGAIALGRSAAATAANQLVIGDSTAGSTTNAITSVYIGNGVTNTTPTGVAINATGGSGTNIAGGALTLAGGKGTGTGVGGSILFQTAAAGSTGAALNSLTTRFTLDSTGLLTGATGSSIAMGATPASAGAIRLTNATAIGWRNAANSGDVTLSVTADNVLSTSSASLYLGSYNVNSPAITRTTAAGLGGVDNIIIGNSSGIAATGLAASGVVRLWTEPTTASIYINAGTSGAAGTVEKMRVGAPTTVDNLANSIFSTSATTSKGVVIQGKASQTANLQEWQSSTGTVQSAIDASGNLVFGSSASSSTGVLRLQNATSIGWRNAANTADKVIKLSSSNTTDGLDMPGAVVIGGSDATAGAVYFFNANVRIGRTGNSGFGINTGTQTFEVLNSTKNSAVGIGAASDFTNGTVEKLRVGTVTTVDNAAYATFGATAAANKALVIQGAASQTANLQEWQDSTGAVKLYVGKTGSFGAVTIGADAATNSSALVLKYAQTLTYLTAADSGNSSLLTIDNTVDSGWKNLLVKAKSGQTGNLQEWQSSTGTVLSSITSGGDLTFGTGSTHTISLATSTTGTGNTLAILGSTGLAAGNNAGGQVTLTGGTGSVSTGLGFGGAGGAVTIAGGTTNGSSWTGNVGGALNLNGGNPALSVNAANATGGAVNINGGTGGTGSGGLAASAGGNGGAIAITAGSGGAAVQNAGAGNQTGGAGANITLTAGSGGVSVGTAANSNGGSITLTAGNAGTGGSGAAGTVGNITLQGVSGSLINIGSNAAAQTITIGNTTGASAVTVQSGTGALNLQTQGTGGINIGTNAVAQTIAIGNSTGATDVNVSLGSGVFNVTNTAADANNVAQFNNAGATTCTVQPGGTGFACSSDARLKTNVLTLANAGDVVNKLRGVSFNWISNPNGQIQSGFIAQELMQVIPGAVSQDGNGFYVANYSAIVPYLVNAFQDSDKRLSALEAKVNDVQLSQGVFNGGIVAGDTEFQAKATFDGLASFKGQTVFAGGATFEGVTNVKGRLQLGNNNTGSATVVAGSTSVHVTLPSGFTSAPNVNLTPQDFVTGQYRVTHVTTTGFDIETSAAQTENVAFYWQAF